MPDQDNMGGLPLPEDIPFQLIAASPDMMDMNFCNKKYPFEFRSSIAISAFEPKDEDLPEDFCKKVTYLKVTVSLTGYKPTQAELAENIVNFIGTSVEHDFDDWDYITRKYFPCFGALLNVAVFPLSEEDKGNLSRYPHITAFEPKRRELIEPMTKEGNILTSSNNIISLGSKNSTTKTTGFDYSPKLTVKKGGLEASMELGGFNHSKNNIEENTNNYSTDVSSSTGSSYKATIDQMYNMLDSYHLGTNRAVFNIMPYPHLKESTDYRTFTQGIKVLEGIQEFFLIVERPRDQKGLCIDVGLQTGHFPEDAEIIPSKPLYRTSQDTFQVSGRAKKERGWPDVDIINKTYTAPSGYIIDRARYGGFSSHITDSIGKGEQDWKDTIGEINVTDQTISFSATLTATIKSGSGITVIFTVYLRAIEPYAHSKQHASLENFMVTSRGLCACYEYESPCLNVVGVKQHPQIKGAEIVDEMDIELRYFNEGDFPLNTLFSTIKNRLYTSGQQPTRNAENQISFFDSEYFIRHWAERLDDEFLLQKIGAVNELPLKMPKHFQNHTVGEFLAMPLRKFRLLKDMKIPDVIAAKRSLLKR